MRGALACLFVEVDVEDEGPASEEAEEDAVGETLSAGVSEATGFGGVVGILLDRLAESARSLLTITSGTGIARVFSSGVDRGDISLFTLGTSPFCLSSEGVGVRIGIESSMEIGRGLITKPFGEELPLVGDEGT